MSKLASLTKARRAHVESCKKNGDNSHKTIADLYSNRTHFVYELLQNADDAKASEAIFDLSAKSLEFKHDGEPFSFRDVEAITSVGASPKENIPNAIGKFGVGFKSVFAVTESPEIYSGEYQFAIVDFIVPEDVPGESVDDEQTLIVLPFNHKSNAPEKSHRQLENELGHLSAESLLFFATHKIHSLANRNRQRRISRRVRYRHRQAHYLFGEWRANGRQLSGFFGRCQNRRKRHRAFCRLPTR